MEGLPGKELASDWLLNHRQHLLMLGTFHLILAKPLKQQSGYKRQYGLRGLRQNLVLPPAW